MKTYIYYTLLLVALISCKKNEEFVFRPAPVPTEPNSGQPRLISGDDKLVMSWITVKGEINELKYSVLEGNSWTDPQVIIADTDWFVNWADFPGIHINESDPNHWITYFLKKSSSETFSYDIHFMSSSNGGKTWSEPEKLHGDSTLTEHGFVSTFDDPEGIGAVWLDGRNTKPGGGHHGEMTLRSGVITKDGRVKNEVLLDDRICDCCQTSVVNTPSGTIALYRDRSENEIRDIWMVKKVENEWQQPVRFSNDNWKIEGCPVNGPTIASRKDLVAAAWYTAANDSARVKMKISKDAGETFSEAILVDKGSPMGRVDITISDNNEPVVSWMELHPQGGAHLMMSIYDNEGELLKTDTVTYINPSRSSGFPQLESFNGQLIFAWTDVETNTINSSIASLR